MMNEMERIIDELMRGYSGDPWHGTPVVKILEGITAEQAAAHPISSANSIWEIVLHMTGWLEETGARVAGQKPGEPARGDWSAVTRADEAGWASAKKDLTGAVEALRLQLTSTPESRLWEIAGPPVRDRAAGTGTTVYVLLHGIVQHNVYHSAQIATIKRLL